MHYAVLCYHDEATVGALTKEEDDALMANLAVVRQELTAEGKLGPVARLMPTTAATTLREGRESLVIDGPFAETKEALLGFYVVDCATLEEAIQVARRLMAPRAAGAGAFPLGRLSQARWGGPLGSCRRRVMAVLKGRLI
jgi:hypothetical protein